MLRSHLGRLFARKQLEKAAPLQKPKLVAESGLKLPVDWCEHPIFFGAHDIIAKRHIIEKALRASVRGTRSEGMALYAILGSPRPAWAQYESARAELGVSNAPIWWDVSVDCRPSDDGIQLFRVEDLRAIANKHGVKGRSKAEITSRLRSVLSETEARKLEEAGLSYWQQQFEDRENRKFYEVLAHGVSTATISITNAHNWLSSDRSIRLTWSSAPCCKTCDRADGKTVVLGKTFPFVKVALPPAHPGCNCVELGE